MNVHERAEWFCEEYTDYVLVDKTRHSIIVNIKKEHFKIVYKELQRLDYEIVFSKTLKDINTITCTFKQKQHV
jgi:hypothetical protein